MLGAWYGLRVLQFILFGSDGSSKDRPLLTADLPKLDVAVLTVMAVLCVVLGVAPRVATQLTQPDVDRLATVLEPAAKGFHPEIDTIASEEVQQTMRIEMASNP